MHLLLLLNKGKTMKTIKLLTFCVLISLKVNAQNTSLADYNKEIIKENFSDDQTQFQLQNNDDNYFIVEGGDLFLNRTNKKSEFTLFSKKLIKSKNYKVKTAIKISPTSDNSSFIGVLINTLLDSKGTLSIEINKKREYRVRQIKNGVSKYISGSSDKKGWVKNNKLKEADEYNYIDIISNNGKIDVYFNFKFANSFVVPEYTSGGLGLIVGPKSQSRIDFLYVHEKSNSIDEDQIKLANLKIKELESSLKKLIGNSEATKNQSEEILKLRAEAKAAKIKYNKLEQDHKTLSVQKTKIAADPQINKNYNEQISQLKAEISSIKKKNSAAGKKITSLTKKADKHRKAYSTLENSVSSLTEKNATNQSATISIKMESQVLSDSIQKLTASYNALLLEKEMWQTEKINNNKNSDELARATEELEKLRANIEVLKIQSEVQRNIALDFATAYRTEKEKSNQYRTEVQISQNSINANLKTENLIEYRVQLGTFEQEINTSELDIDKLNVIITKDNKYIYLSGKFNDYNVAKSHLLEIYQKGFKDSYIVKF